MGGIASLETLPGKPLPTGEIKNPIAPEDVAGTLEKVISDLHRVIEIDPSIKEAYYFLGVAYLKKADRDEAISAFYRALDAEPDRETTYILLCYLLWDASEYKEALDVTSGYAARFPDSEATAAILTGKTYFYLKDYQKALGYGLRLIQLDRSRWEGPALAAASYYCLGDRQSAAEQFKALEANPKSSGDIAQLKKDLKEKCGE
jgi:tetratricopeptide (TPR) repeat protein